MSFDYLMNNSYKPILLIPMLTLIQFSVVRRSCILIVVKSEFL